MTTKYEKVQKIHDIPVAYTCDVCGEEYAVDDPSFEAQEFIHLDYEAGYASIFGDGTHVECDICQHCLKELLDDALRLTSPWEAA